MTAIAKQDIPAIMAALGRRAKAAAHTLAQAGTGPKNRALLAAADSLRANAETIKKANSKDMAGGVQHGLSPAMLDRLMLDDDRIEAMARGLADIAALPDPVGTELARWTPKNGLDIARVRVPLGVIGIIYESRPNVTADAGALCLKSGNACILRGGSESFHSSHAILECLHEGLRAAKLDPAAIQMIPTTDRDAVGIMLTMSDSIDVIVPRGGKNLIRRISAESRIPMFKHLEGICHTYVDRSADPEMARKVVLNAKMRRTGICGATETVLVDRAVADSHLPGVIADLLAAGCEIRGDETVQALESRVRPAAANDWDQEYLDAIVSIKVVDGIDAALTHIERHGSHHTDAIVASDPVTAERFLNEVDSAIVLWNASTQFADGGEFGMGAEIGISTGKLHARGPVGVEQLTSFKYLVRGKGETRS